MARQKTSLFELERRRARPMGHVSGRPPQRPSGLRALERECLGRCHAAPVVAQSFDTGEAITVRTARGRFPLIPQQVSARHAARPFALAFSAAEYGDAAWVEPFDEPVSLEPRMPDPPAYDREYEPPAPAIPDPAAAVPRIEPALPPTVPAIPVADDELDADIQQVLDRAATQPAKSVPPEPIIAKPEPPAPQPQPAVESQSLSRPHALFDAMARGLGHATTFDLGRVDLNRRLNQIERALDAEEEEPARSSVSRRFSSSAALDDHDLIEDLSAVSSLLEQKLREQSRQQPRKPAAEAPATSTTPAVAKPPAASPPTNGLPALAAPAPAPGSTPPEAARPAADVPASKPDDAPGAPVASSVDIRYTVPLLRATTAVPAPAAAAAMILAWREQRPVDVEALVAGSGPWAAYRTALLLTGPAFFESFELAALKPEPLTVPRLTELLVRHGPLWLQDPKAEAHVRVVTGLAGDGSAGGTAITSIDPAAANDLAETTDINSLAGRLGGGPVRIAYLAG